MTFYPSDQELVQQVLSGKEAAFSQLILRYRERLMRLLYYYVNNWEDAQDLCQETFIRLYHSLRRYDLRKPFAPWLYRIAVNLARDFLRRRKVRPAAMPLDLPCSPPLPDSSPSMDSVLISKETYQKVIQAIEELPQNYREVLVLRYLEDFSYSEIASILGISEANVMMRVSRARKMLREKLANVFGESGE